MSEEARAHARSLMEGLKGTAIRLAVRDLSCPQDPGPGCSSAAPVSVRGPILRVAQATTTLTAASPVPAHPGRRVAVDRGGRCRGPDLYFKDQALVAVHGSPGTSRQRVRPPAAILVKGSWSRIATAVREVRSCRIRDAGLVPASVRELPVFIGRSRAGAGEPGTM
jgi:hypothetical protein